MAITSKDTVTVARSELDKIIDTRNSDLALYYLYRINHPASTIDDASNYLSWTFKRAESVSKELDSLLIKKCPIDDDLLDIPLEEEFIRKTYSVQDVLLLGNVDPEFTTIINSANKIFGTPAMGQAYMMSLYAIYKELHFSTKEVKQILMYLNDTKGKVHASDIRREGYRRYTNKVFGNTDLSGCEIHDEIYFSILEALGYKEKKVPPEVNKFIYHARGKGYIDKEILKIAAEKCISKIHKLESTYALKLLDGFRNEGIETIEAYNKKYVPITVHGTRSSKKMLSSIERYSDDPIHALDLEL